MSADPVKVVFVCWGNICRSPIAERVAERAAAEAGLTGVEFTSAATSREEIGAPIDPRARRVLTEHGYRAEGHSAHQITSAEIADADLVVAAEPLHVDRMLRIAPSADNLSLLSDYDPAAQPGSGLPDPWYGGAEGFEETLAAVEAAMPGVLDQVRRLQR
ncbi:MAG: low molecular weight protein-tyrosine-phosphatase [Janthinobacterium lividum]